MHAIFIIQEAILFIVVLALQSAEGGSFLRTSWLKTPHKWLNSSAIINKFCRYADDNQLYVKSRKAAERVMEGITAFIENKLKLKVNRAKSAIDRPWKRKFLGFSFKAGRDGHKSPSQISQKRAGED